MAHFILLLQGGPLFYLICEELEAQSGEGSQLGGCHETHRTRVYVSPEAVPCTPQPSFLTFAGSENTVHPPWALLSPPFILKKKACFSSSSNFLVSLWKVTGLAR